MVNQFSNSSHVKIKDTKHQCTHRDKLLVYMSGTTSSTVNVILIIDNPILKKSTSANEKAILDEHYSHISYDKFTSTLCT